MTIRTDLAASFRRLHRPQDGTILILPNAWDAMSARVIEHAGARAIATTSAGVSWALGRPDGQGLTRSDAVEAVRRIARAVGVPVSADIERGYGSGSPEDVAETVRAVVDAGAVGINLEDAPGRGEAPLLRPEEHAARIAAARAAGGPELFINARVDVYLAQAGAESGRFDETVRRARTYAAAGADGVFVPGILDASTIARLVKAIAVPVNIMASYGAPAVGELAALGVARVSVGPSITGAAMATIRAAARELLGTGTYDALVGGIPFTEANALFAASERRSPRDRAHRSRA
jgi:2-methylisocitrate lyase-like PEP mutase family enzyme